MSLISPPVAGPLAYLLGNRGGKDATFLPESEILTLYVRIEDCYSKSMRHVKSLQGEKYLTFTFASDK